MPKHLLVVESPAKAKTINKYLGKDFTVLASYGHVRDLVPKEGAVDPDHGFAMRYETIEKNEKHVEAIAKAAKSAEGIFLATDPDREGEAISWHIAEILKEKNLVKDKPHFVIDANVDRAFQRAGFAEEAVFCPQGDLGRFQCAAPCNRRTYDNEAAILAMIAEQKDMRIPAALVPRCPNCGAATTSWRPPTSACARSPTPTR